MLVLDCVPGLSLGPFSVGKFLGKQAVQSGSWLSRANYTTGCLINDALKIARQNAQTYGCVELKYFRQVLTFAPRVSAA